MVVTMMISLWIVMSRSLAGSYMYTDLHVMIQKNAVVNQIMFFEGCILEVLMFLLSLDTCLF
jgi:hypothetical protein